MKIITSFQEKVEKTISDLDLGKGPEGLLNPIAYMLSLGGKRVRPALCLAGCALFDKSRVESSMPAAIALELFHNFTLVHDDIMDNSTVRRNKPTVHQKWDINSAILSGDAMMIMAYQWIASVPKDIISQVLNLFSVTAMEVCQGQQLDMEFETRENVSEAEYLEMIRLKTAVLIGASLGIGALVGKANDEDLKNLIQFGTCVGISFQLHDDWLDVFGDSERFGKKIGGDIINNKKTYLLINTLNNLKPARRAQLITWTKRTEFDREEKVNEVRALYEEAGSGKRARELMNNYLSKALASLDGVQGDGTIKEDLKVYVNQMMERSR